MAPAPSHTPPDPSAARAAATQIVTTLRDAGHIAYFAGGCVRDELLDLAPTDYDVATDATPDRVASLFPRATFVGAAFGVVLVPMPPATVEVATFRSDGVYSDARRPDEVRFSDPLADAQRRDFTINAIFLDPLSEPDPALPRLHRVGAPPRGRIIDYVGGLADLDAGVLRAVGDPDQRLAEDHLRALRAVRFTARLGFAMDAGTAGAISRHAADLRGVSRERIGEEVRRMLRHPSRAEAMALLQDLGLDAPVLNESSLQVDLPTLRGLRRSSDNGEIGYATCLAAWAFDRAGVDGPEEGGVAAPARSRRARSRAEGLIARWREALKLSNDERDELAAILSGYERLRSGWGSLGVAGQKRLAAQAWFVEALRILNVRQPEVAAAVTARAEELGGSPGGIAPPPLVTGDDLILAGMKTGPAFKRVLDAVYDAQLEGRVHTKSEAMELAKGLCV